MLLSIVVAPSISFAGVPTVDIIGTPQAFIETIQTIAGKVENSKQVLTIQKTMSKMGSAKSSISDFINKQKDAVTKYKEKMDNYIAKGKEYAAKAEAYKAEALKYAEKAKEIKEQGLGNYLKDKADNLKDKTVDGLAEKGLDLDKMKSVGEQVTSGDVKGLAGSVGVNTNKVEGLVDSIRDADLKSKATKMVGDVVDGADVDLNKAQELAKDNRAKGKENSKVKDTPSVKTVRKSGGFSSGATSKTSNEKSKEKAIAIAKNKKSSAGGGASGLVGSAKAQPDKEITQKSAIGSAEVGASSAGKAKSDIAGADKKALKEAKAQSGKETAQKEVVKAADVDASLAGKAKSDIAGADKKASAGGGASDLASADKKALKEAKAQSGKEMAQKEAVKAAKVGASSAGKDKSKEKDTNVSKNIKKETSKPKRAKFKSSFGYGKIQNKHQLLFASVEGGAETGETSDGMLIVPESISMYCNLNYKTAIEDKNMEDCLRNINTISTSEVIEDNSREKIDDVTKDFLNGYIELLASSYFEALETYNDGLTFKNNKLDPVITTLTSDVDGSWRIVKEMHLVLGERVNNLRKLWSRATSVKMYEKFRNEKFTKEGQ